MGGHLLCPKICSYAHQRFSHHTPQNSSSPSSTGECKLGLSKAPAAFGRAHFESKTFNMPVSHTWPLPCSWAQGWAPTGIHLVENAGAQFLAGAVYGAVHLELESPGVFPLHQQFMTAGMEWGWWQQSQNPRGSTGSGDGSHTSPLTT